MPAEPAASFEERCCAAVCAAVAAGRPFDAIYVSQTAYLTQQTLIPDIPAFVSSLRAAAGLGKPACHASIPQHRAGTAGSSADLEAGQPGEAAGAQAAPAAGPEAPGLAGAAGVAGGSMAPPVVEPLVIVDAYHGFCALPTNLAAVAGDCCYVAGLVKHAGGGGEGEKDTGAPGWKVCGSCSAWERARHGNLPEAQLSSSFSFWF